MPKYSLPQLRTFRHSVSILKKKGLVTGIDARKALPAQKVKGRSLRHLVDKYDDVISGKVATLKVTRSQLRKYKKVGYDSANGRILVPVSTNQTARIKNGQVVTQSTTGIDTVHIPVEYHNLEQYLTDIEKNAKEINRMKRNDEYFAFRLDNNNSYTAYAQIQMAIEDLRKYDSVINADTKKKQKKFYNSLVILKINKRGTNFWDKMQANRKPATTKEYQRKRAAKYRDNFKHLPLWKQGKIMDQIAERMETYRARLKKNPKSYETYKEAARVRAKKSRDAKKKVTKKRRPKK